MTMDISFNERLRNPYDHEARLKKLEDEVKRLWLRTGAAGAGAGMGGRGGIMVAGAAGKAGMAQAIDNPTLPEVYSVVEDMELTDGATAQPFLTVTIDPDFQPPVGAIGYTVRVQPQGAAAYEVNGPDFNPDTGVLYEDLSPVVVKRPPFGPCDFQVKLRTLKGDSPFGPVCQYSIQKDTRFLASESVGWTLYDANSVKRMTVGANGQSRVFFSGDFLEGGIDRFTFQPKAGVALSFGKTGADNDLNYEGRAFFGEVQASVAKHDTINNFSNPLLTLEVTGDEYGGTRMELLNRGGANGVRFTLVPDNPDIALIDFIFAHPGGSSNIRLEGRGVYAMLGTANEWQFGAPGNPHTVFSDAGLFQRAGALKGRMLVAGDWGSVVGELATSTGTVRSQAVMGFDWADSTDATRKGRMMLTAIDWAGNREGLRVEADGTAARLGFYGATAQAKQTVSGAKAGNVALTNLLTALHNLGLIQNSTT
jgi:hypothetical protein